jgi:hypothetical protein
MAGVTDSLSSFGAHASGTGPRLAQKRAEELAKAVGGTIEKASTALEPGQWVREPVQWTYDFKAMEAARAVREARISAGTQVHAQILGQAMDEMEGSK